MSVLLSPHSPVMLQEVLEYLKPEDGCRYVDGTFGAGGYSRAILTKASCEVIGIDRDPTTEAYAKDLSKLTWIQGNYSEMQSLLASKNITKVDGIVLDLGVSSMQLDQAERGFSFMQDGPLDMRMSQNGADAAYFVNHASERELADVIYHYGGERRSRHIARRIVNERQKEPITRTLQLANIVRSVVRKSGNIDPATRTFQAIRIWVNDELEHLKQGLYESVKLLQRDGRLVIVSFHSLEDRLIKFFFRQLAGKGNDSDGMLMDIPENAGEWNILTKRVVKPTDQEIRVNPRARSAKLRAIQFCKEGGEV